jgi:Arc/MetJ family transcription regulator
MRPLPRCVLDPLYIRRGSVYTGSVAKRLVDIDDDLLTRARRAAGTPTIKATVEAGLRRLVNSELTERHVRRLRGRGGLNLRLVEEARAPRRPGRG